MPSGGASAPRDLVLENLALRHQQMVLKRKAKTPTSRNSDQLFRSILSSTCSRWSRALVFV
jgi:hypothetical protein